MLNMAEVLSVGAGHNNFVQIAGPRLWEDLDRFSVILK